MLTEWAALRAPATDVVLVTACVATPVPGWVEDMRPAVEARTTGLAAASAARIAGEAVDARPAADGTFEVRPASHVDGPSIGRARTFLGFDESRVLTCLAACAREGGRRAEGADETCGRIVADARLEGSRPPPAPGVALRSATWAVHHPRVAAAGALAAIVLAGLLAVMARRRPRSTIA